MTAQDPAWSEEKAIAALDKIAAEIQEKPKEPFISAADLDRLVLPEPAFLVEPILPEGLALLAGRPKLGKSWLALGIAHACAKGAMALASLKTQKVDVLYLALEDNRRRLQKRNRAVLQGADQPANLHLATEWPKLDEGGLEQIQQWLDDHSNGGLVVIDTLVKVRQRRKPNADLYDADHDSVVRLKALADEYNICIIVVHHTRKAEANDPLDEISGSTGLTGAVDTCLVLKRDRADADAVLFVTGRDIEEAELALRFDAQTGLWAALGDAEQFRRSKQRTAIIRALLEIGRPTTPKQLAEYMEQPAGRIKKLLYDMRQDGEVTADLDGRYSAVE